MKVIFVITLLVNLLCSSISLAAVLSNQSNVSGQVKAVVTGLVLNRTTHTYDSTLTLTNTGNPLYTSITVAVTGLPANVKLQNATSTDNNGNPSIVVALPNLGWLTAQKLPAVTVKFSNPKLIKFGISTLIYGTNIPPVAVTTYHNDNLRTGWNANETLLTPANVADTAKFGLLNTVTLDDQVDAQPLLVPNVSISKGNFTGTHNVVYVVTESNTVYAIDALSGQILLSSNLGSPVVWPITCMNNGPNVGITSTPVIDPIKNLLYLITYTSETNGPVYRIHALDLGSLTDKIPPVVITASHKLTDGSVFTFNATYQRQRPALILTNNNVYAGFGSFCDLGGNKSRGWLLGWSSDTLQPLTANQLTDSEATNTLALSAIWMSGYGISSNASGQLFFITGNSGSNADNTTSYNGVSNIQESVVKVSPDLSTVTDIFTPYDVKFLDDIDGDFGASGVLLLPPQPGKIPNLAVAAGKNGLIYLLNSDNLGGYTEGGPDNVLGISQMGACFCGQSMYVDGNGIAHVVTSGGLPVNTWKVQTSSTEVPQLIHEATSQNLSSGQDWGFFTSISSAASVNQIIWAVSRPLSSTSPIKLYAFDPNNSLATIFTADAGTWPNIGGNANLVPVVANGYVYVASYKQLAIFGLLTK
ncbi:hypothetical protein [Methylomonas sp. AM2-LC]|uniref:hypothetical protein n=1 Tax=Methylomonas sp. AM2-LC TaxID=3153301 RepID=UPI003265F223